MWYARFVRVLRIRIIGSDLERKHRELVYALVEHNGGESVFPSLQELQWTPSSPFDRAYFPLFTPKFYTAAFRFSRAGKETISPVGDELEDDRHDNFLTRLQATSPRLYYLCVHASWQRLNEDRLIRAMCSFEHLVNLELICTIPISSFCELAAMPHLESLLADHVWSGKPPSSSLPCPGPAQISAPQSLFLSVLGKSHLLTNLFTALHAPHLRATTVTIYHDSSNSDSDSDSDPGYIPCLKALATFPLEEVEISLRLLAPVPPPRMRLATLLSPLLRRLPNVMRFALACSCAKLRLVVDDNDFVAVARAWPRLRTFKLTQMYWDAPTGAADSGVGGGDELEDEYGYYLTDDGNAQGHPAADGEHIRIGGVPTPEVLRVFREHCPDLRELVLPYLDLRTGVPLLYADLLSLPPHGLRRLAFGAQTAVVDEREEEARAREMVLGNLTPKALPGLDVVSDDKAEEWARYILDLFPTLNPGKSITDCVFTPAASGWIEVLRRVRRMRRAQKGSDLKLES